MDIPTREWLENALLVFLRAGGLLAVFPMFSARSVPAHLRIALGALLAALLSPLLPEPPPAPDLLGLVGLMTSELAIGLALGFVCRLVFFGLEIAGGIIGMEIGLTLAPMFDPLNGGQSSAPGAVLYYLAIVLWLGLDLHHWLLAAFQKTYALLPPGGANVGEAVLSALLGRCLTLFVLALQIAAPVLAVSFLLSLIFSLLGRAVPQMNAFAESFSVRILAGLAVFGLTSQLMAQHILSYLSRLPEDLLTMARLIAG